MTCGVTVTIAMESSHAHDRVGHNQKGWQRKRMAETETKHPPGLAGYRADTAEVVVTPN